MENSSGVADAISKYSISEAVSSGRSIEDELEARWLDTEQDTKYQGITAGDLADYLNKRILRRVYREHNRKYRQSFIDSQYETLKEELSLDSSPDFRVTDSSTEDVELIIELKKDGVDIEEVVEDFVNPTEVSFYLTESLGISPVCPVRQQTYKYDLNRITNTSPSVDDILRERWTDDDQFPNTTTESLVAWFNQGILQSLYESHDITLSADTLREEYLAISDRNHPLHDSVIEKIDEAGVDSTQLQTDFVSEPDIHTHLIDCLDLEDCCKVGRITLEYQLDKTVLDRRTIDDELEARWLGKMDYPEVGVRKLVNWYNQKIVRQTYMDANRETVSPRVKTEYEIINNEDHPDHEELLTDLETSGVDVEKLTADLIPDATMYRHLTSCLNLEKSSESNTESSETWKNQVDFALDTVEDKVGRALKSLENSGTLPNATRAGIETKIIVQCPECGTQVALSRAAKRGYICEDHMTSQDSSSESESGSSIV